MKMSKRLMVVLCNLRKISYWRALQFVVVSYTQGKKPQDDDELGRLLSSSLTQEKNP
jgi:hypothetical protein